MGTAATRLKQEQMVKEKRTWLLFLELTLWLMTCSLCCSYKEEDFLHYLG